MQRMDFSFATVMADRRLPQSISSRRNVSTQPQSGESRRRPKEEGGEGLAELGLDLASILLDAARAEIDMFQLQPSNSTIPCAG
jgi:hypothetical protein